MSSSSSTAKYLMVLLPIFIPPRLVGSFKALTRGVGECLRGTSCFSNYLLIFNASSISIRSSIAFLTFSSGATISLPPYSNLYALSSLATYLSETLSLSRELSVSLNMGSKLNFIILPNLSYGYLLNL